MYTAPAALFSLFSWAAGRLKSSDTSWRRLRNRGIHISTTENNDVVPLASVSPLLILDMWEHAYLPMNHFDKAAYVEDWFSLIDWGKANERYLAALSGAALTITPSSAAIVPYHQ